MVVRYLRSTGQLTPQIEQRSLNIIRKGYQRLLTFQKQGGGFGLYPHARYDPRLSAYGLAQLSEMSEVIYVDPDVIARTRSRLLKDLRTMTRQRRVHAHQQSNVAFIVWSLASSGTTPSELRPALDWLAGQVGGQGRRNAYFEALALRALAIARPDAPATRAVMDRFLEAAVDKGDHTYWANRGSTFMGGYGRSGNIELTALVAGAMQTIGGDQARLQRVLDWLVRSRNPRGFWGSTFSTVQTLSVLLATTGERKGKGAVAVRCSVGDAEPVELSIPLDQTDLVKVVDITKLIRSGKNAVALKVIGEGQMTYSLVWRAYRPWTAERKQGPLSLALRYDRTRVRPGLLVTGTATVQYRGEQTSSMVILDIGLPPGFQLDRRSLQVLRQRGQIDRYDLRGRKLSLYLDRLKPGSTLQLRFRLRAGRRMKAKAAPSRVWEYYAPDNQAEAVPPTFVVE